MDFGKMFAVDGVKAVKKSNLTFTNPIQIMDWRKDLSDKVKEHVELVEKLVHCDTDELDLIKLKINAICEKVLEVSESQDSLWTKLFFKKGPQEDYRNQVQREFLAVEESLKRLPKTDPFKVREATTVVEQAKYLVEQLAKAGKELDDFKASTTDVVEIDFANRRASTLFSQQQLVAMGCDQAKLLAANIQTRPHQIDELLNVVIPTQRLLCLDIIQGTKKAQELRNIL